jgi:lipoyl(octanoyl) transferase
MRALHVRRLGVVEYEDGLAAQKLLVEARAQGLVPDTLLLLEHPRVVTLGRGAHAANVLWSKAQLEQRGFELYETSRGGDVTYHGPGQLVGYPILDLKPDRKDVRKYVGSVEELMIRVAQDYGLRAERVAGRTGIWTQPHFETAGIPPRGTSPPAAAPLPAATLAKLGAIGVHISRWITSHGFAFNVATDLADFEAIVPCGISDAGVASLQSLLGRAPPMAEVEDRFAGRAAEVWDSEVFEVPHELQTISVAIRRASDGRLLLLHRTPDRGGFWQILTGRIEPGESPLAAAAREVFEETGFEPRLEELQSLNYVHSFPIDRSRGRGGAAPIFAHETAFALEVEGEARLSDEHDELRWCTLDEALQLLPFAGLRKVARLAYSQNP